ncbi:MAG: malate/lactate/ureidoglycolate dehydrogenase [Beijerinckiaceae bacterium]|nr:malate/lactate/ureidoglycolate dehydrogenase [Beijerinckiaceae bacterium]
MPLINSAALTDFIAEIFARAKSSSEEARRIAQYLVTANLTGHDSHGVIRVPIYVERTLAGGTVPDQTVEVLVDLPALAVIDGRFGYGQTVGPQAVRIGMDKAKAGGVAAMALRNSGHIGRIGDWAEMAAADGLVSIFFVNVAGSVLVAPFGGVERRLSTAPFCVGIPRPGADPVILDFATSLVAEGKALVASRGGKPLPDDALIDADGTISGDPHVLYGPYEFEGPRNYMQGTGALRAFGDHKGSGLALICELLGGALTGNGATGPGKRFANGMLAIFIDPARADPVQFFGGDMAEYLAYYKSSKPAEPGGEILTPGETEQRYRRERTANGIMLPDDAWSNIVATAKAVGLGENRVVIALQR